MYKYFFSHNVNFKISKNIISGRKIREKKPYIYVPKEKKIYVFDKYGNFIQVFFNTKFACDELKTNASTILMHLRNKTICNYKWLLSHEDKVDAIRTDVPIYQFDLEGKFMFEFENINDAVKVLKNTYTDTYNSIILNKPLKQKYHLRLEK